MPIPAEKENHHPLTNGDVKSPSMNGNDKGDSDNSIAPVCAELATRINAFLEEDVKTDILRDVQKQTRIALGIIEECLQKYTYVLIPSVD